MSDSIQKPRDSFERRINAKCLAICETCFDYTINPIALVAEFVDDHMCDGENINQKRSNLMKVQEFVDKNMLLLSRPSAQLPPPTWLPKMKRRLSKEVSEQDKKRRRLSDAS